MKISSNGRIVARFLIVGMVILGILACDANLPQDLKAPVDELQKNELPKTVEALASKEGAHVLATMEALASKEGNQAIATVEAFATSQGQKALATGQAFAEDKGGDMLSTAAAYAGKENISATVEAAVANAKDYISGDSPQDIPLVDVKTISALYKSKAMITYATSLEFEKVVEFYKKEMTGEGWSIVAGETTENNFAAVLVYNKNGRKASVTLTPKHVGGGTAVMVILSE